jgi:AraC-like DNA-binding protein
MCWCGDFVCADWKHNGVVGAPLVWRYFHAWPRFENCRSSLAERFTHLVGQPPMQYRTHWRMQMAAGMLSGGSANLATIAKEVGYESHAAFSRVFKKVVGGPPATWRRQQNQK